MTDKGRKDNLSTDEIIAKLKESVDNSSLEERLSESDIKKKYKFRRTEKKVQHTSENEKDEILIQSEASSDALEDTDEIDVGALMKKYLSKEEYEKFSRRDETSSFEEDDFSDTRDFFQENEPVADNEYNAETSYNKGEAFTEDRFAAPDKDLYSTLSAGGKVCDIPSFDSAESTSVVIEDKTRISDTVGDTAQFTKVIDADQEQEAFKDGENIASVQDKTAVFEVFEAETKAESSKKEDTAEEVFDVNEEKKEKGYSSLEIDQEELMSIVGSEIDETDANLMIAFGMDEELENTVGKEKAEKILSDNEKAVSLPDEDEKKLHKKEKIKDVEEPIVGEFISPVEAKGIIEDYKEKFGKNSLKIFELLAIAIVLFFYENILTLGGKMPDFLNPNYYPVVNIMIGLQILLLGFVLCRKSVERGIKALKETKPVPESFLPVILAVNVIYSIFASFFGARTVPVTYFFPAAVCLFLCAVNERLDLRREIMTFNVVSSKRMKYALEKLDYNDSELETKAFEKYLPKNPSVFKINKTSFVDGYFYHTNTYPSIKLILNAFIMAAAVIFIASAVLGAIILKDFSKAMLFAYSAFSFSLPAIVFILFGLPSFKASKLAYSEGSAFVGEAALDEYTSVGSISFEDRDVFPTSGVKLRSIKVFGEGRIDTAVYNVASIYSQIGGPLSDVLNVATADFGRSEDTELINIDNEGVEAVVDGNHIFVGKDNYLRRKGYIPIADACDDELVSSGEMSILYLVLNDDVVAKFYLRYRIDPGFEAVLKKMYKSGICVGIKTMDPNISDEMLGTKIKIAKYPVKVLKYSSVLESKRGVDRTDSGIVSKKSSKALLKVFTLCDKIKHVMKTNIAVNIIAALMGLVICTVTAVIGNVMAVPSFYVVLFQLFWMVPIYLLSKFMIL